MMAFADATEIIGAHLRDVLPDHGVDGPVMSRVFDPSNVNERPDRCVIVRRLGGAMRGVVVDGATLSIEVYADTEYDAMTDALIVRGAVLALAGEVVDGVQVYRVDEFAGPAQIPDGISNQPRVTYTVDVWLRAAAPVGGS